MRNETIRQRDCQSTCESGNEPRGQSLSRRALRRAVVAAILVLVLPAVLMQSGCAVLRPAAPPSALEPPAIRSVEEAIDVLRQNYGGTNSLKASGKITFTFPGEKLTRQASMALMLQRPNKIRMRVYRPLAPPLFEYISNGNTCWVYISSRQAAYLNEKCGPLRIDEGGFGISAGALVAAFFVLADPDTASHLPVSIRHEEDSVGLEILQDDGTRRQIWIDPATGYAARQLLIEADGTVQADIRYIENGLHEGAAIPVIIEVTLPKMETTISMQMSRHRINAMLPDGAFDFVLPEGAHILQSDTDPIISSNP